MARLKPIRKFFIRVSLPHATVDNLLDCMFHNKVLSPDDSFDGLDDPDRQPIRDTIFKGFRDANGFPSFTSEECWRLDDYFNRFMQFYATAVCHG